METYLKFDKRLTPKIEKAPKAPKIRKPIARIGKRTKERIKDNGSESELFERIWNERRHVCVMCLKDIPEPLAECFSHKLSKGRYPLLRYEPKNVALVCSARCHQEHDRSNAHKDAQILREILS